MRSTIPDNRSRPPYREYYPPPTDYNVYPPVRYPPSYQQPPPNYPIPYNENMGLNYNEQSRYNQPPPQYPPRRSAYPPEYPPYYPPQDQQSYRPHRQNYRKQSQSQEHEESNRIYISNSHNYPRDRLQEMCQSQGHLIDFLFRNDFAFAEFHNLDDASRALYFFKDLGLKCEYSKNKGGKDLEYLESQPRIYIRGIGQRNGEAKIVQYFQQYGEIVDTLIKDEYVFIEYRTAKCAMKAIQGMNGQMFDNVKLHIEAAKPKQASDPQRLQNSRVYIGHINGKFTKEDINQIFSQHGKIIDLTFQPEYAFVEYTAISEAAEAIKELNGKAIKGVKISVEESKPLRNKQSSGQTNYSHNNRQQPQYRDQKQQFHHHQGGLQELTVANYKAMHAAKSTNFPPEPQKIAQQKERSRSRSKEKSSLYQDAYLQLKKQEQDIDITQFASWNQEQIPNLAKFKKNI